MHLHVPGFDPGALCAGTAFEHPWRDLDPRALGPVGAPSDKQFRGSSPLAGYIAERDILRRQLPASE